MSNDGAQPLALVAQNQTGEGKEYPPTPATLPTATPPDTDHVFGFVLTITDKHHISHWVMDSGATSSATFDEADCVDVKDCDVQITAAGSSFSVKRIGTAVVHALDVKGRPQKMTLSNCLISPLFPYKLLSLQCFTKKGHTVTMAENVVHISNKVNDIVLVGARDPTSQLFLLQETPTVLPDPQPALLAKSYGWGRFALEAAFASRSQELRGSRSSVQAAYAESDALVYLLCHGEVARTSSDLKWI